MSLDKLSPSNIKKAFDSGWFMFLVMTVSGLAIITPVLGVKVSSVFGLKFTSGLITIALFYCLIDVINEVWGKVKAAQSVIFVTLIKIIIFGLFVPVVMSLPTALAPKGFTTVMESIARIFFASEVAVLLGNLVFDIPLFAWLKNKKIKGGFFLRTNLSNIFSTVFSSAIFILVGFWGQNINLMQLFMTQFVIRFILSFLFTPFTTMLTFYLKRKRS